MIIIYGHLCIETLSRIEAPLEVNAQNKTLHSHTSAGGSAFLQSVSAARCGAKIAVIGSIGSDIFGDIISTALRREGILSSGVAKTDETTGTISKIIEPTGSITTLSSIGANALTNTDQIAEHTLNERALLVLQDDIPIEDQAELVALTKSRGGRVMLCLKSDAPYSGNDTDIILQKEKISGDFDTYCGTYAACIQAGMDNTNSHSYAKTAARITSSRLGGYGSLPYLHEIENAIEEKAS